MLRSPNKSILMSLRKTDKACDSGFYQYDLYPNGLNQIKTKPKVLLPGGGGYFGQVLLGMCR